jgi:hypothetical protein
LTKEQLAFFIKQGKVVNATMQMYKGQIIIRPKDVPVKDVKGTNTVQTKSTVQNRDTEKKRDAVKKTSASEIYEKQERAKREAKLKLEESVREQHKEFTDFRVDIKHKLIEKYIGKSSRVVIPEGTLGIGLGAFKDDLNITEVVIPNSVKVIGDFAFMNCKNLKRVEINQNDSRLNIIGNEAFSGTGITDIELPDGLNKLGTGAFKYCGELRHIKFSENLNFIPAEVCAVCKKLEHVEIPSNITVIDDGAFSFCNLQNGQDGFCNVIPKDCEFIGDRAFIGNVIMNPIIPYGVKIIGERAFANTGSKVSLPDDAHIDDMAFAGVKDALIYKKQPFRFVKDTNAELKRIGFEGSFRLLNW